MNIRGKDHSQKILVFCIFASVLVHVLGLGFLFYNFTFMSPGPEDVVIEETLSEDQLDAIESPQVVDLILETPPALEVSAPSLFPKEIQFEENVISTFFANSSKASTSGKTLSDFPEVNDKPVNTYSFQDPKEKFSPISMFSSLLTKEETFTADLHDRWVEEWKNSPLTLSEEKESSLLASNVFPKTEKVDDPNFSFEKSFFPKDQKLGRRPSLFLGDLSLQKKIFVKGQKKKRKTFAHHARPIAFAPVPLPIPSIKELNTINCANDFTYDIVYSKSEDGDGYIFALTLLPLPSENWKKITQNFFFVIDTSNSITNKRLTATRNAVSSCLHQLGEGDAFNVMTFDHDLRNLFEGSSTPDREAKKLAKSFLIKTQLGSFFSNATYQLPFEKIHSYARRESEIHSIILLTNGDGLDKKKNYSFLKEWSKQNQGKYSLYSLSLTNDPSLGIIDFFSSVNRGKMISVTTEKGLRRQLQKLVHSIKAPIAKNVAASVYPSKKTKVDLSFPGGLKPHIFSDSPYVIIGKISALEDFDLFLQGRNTESYFNIKKRISFENAQDGGRALKKEWSLHKSYPMYQKFLYEGSLEHLQEVKKLLSPYSLQTAF